MGGMNAPLPVFGFLDWLVLLGYMALMVGIGVAVSRKQRDTEGFFLGNRAMPAWAVALSVLATSLSAATFIGVPQIAYGGDLTYLVLNLGGIIAAFIVAFLFIPPIYRSGTTTIYGYLGQRFGAPSSMAASVMFLFGRLLASGARLYMAAIAFSLMLHGDIGMVHLLAAVLLLGVIGTLYTAFGGIKAVIWTDVVQIGVVTFVAGLSVWLLLKAIPLSMGEIITALQHADGGSKLRVIDPRLGWNLEYTLFSGLVAGTFVSTACYGVDHDLAQRMMTVKSPWRGGAAMVASTFLAIPVVLLFMVIGLLLYIYYDRPDLMGDRAPLDLIDDTRKVYPQYLLSHLPTGLRGLSMAGLFAAAMSSFDSAINAMASTAMADLYLPWRRTRGHATDGAIRESRAAVAMMGLLLTLFAAGAVWVQSVDGASLIGFALGVMAFALAPLLGVFSTALFTRRGNNGSVLAAFAMGILCVLLLQPYMLPKWLDFTLGWPWVWVAATPMSFLVCAMGAPKGCRPCVPPRTR